MDKWKGRVGYQTNQLDSTDLRLQYATQWVLHNWQGRKGCESNQLDPTDVNAKCNPFTMDKCEGRVGYQTNQLNLTDLRLQNATQWALHNWQGRKGCESKP